MMFKAKETKILQLFQINIDQYDSRKQLMHSLITKLLEWKAKLVFNNPSLLKWSSCSPNIISSVRQNYIKTVPQVFHGTLVDSTHIWYVTAWVSQPVACRAILQWSCAYVKTLHFWHDHSQSGLSPQTATSKHVASVTLSCLLCDGDVLGNLDSIWIQSIDRLSWSRWLFNSTIICYDTLLRAEWVERKSGAASFCLAIAT